MKAAPGATRRPHASDEWMPPRPPARARTPAGVARGVRRSAFVPCAARDDDVPRPALERREAALHALPRRVTTRSAPPYAARCALQPRLKHQHRPQLVLPVHPPGHVLPPQALDRGRIEEAFLAQPRRPQQRLGPIPQRAAQPVIDGRAETLLRPVDQRGRHVPVEQPAQQRLRLPFRQTHRRRHAPREFDDVMIEERHAFRGSRPSPRDRLSRGCRSAGT